MFAAQRGPIDTGGPNASEAAAEAEEMWAAATSASLIRCGGVYTAGGCMCSAAARRAGHGEVLLFV